MRVRRLDRRSYCSTKSGSGFCSRPRAGWRDRRLPPETLIKSLVPLYLGKVASFIAETRDGTDEEAEARLDTLAAAFERNKDMLRELWRAGAR